MSCKYWNDEGRNGYYCTAKKGYISFVCSCDDTSCRYYSRMNPEEEECPYYYKCDYSGSGCWNYRSCRHYIYDDIKINNNDDESDNGGGCYLTTACCVWKGLSDDCMELETLRKFRDSYMSSFQQGLTDIRLYYKVGPLLVKAIEESEERDDILRDIYEAFVCPCVELIKKNRLDETYQLYKKYTLSLYNKLIGHNPFSKLLLDK